MATTYFPLVGVIPIGVIHKVSNAGFFNGALPASDPVNTNVNETNGTVKYPQGTVGGLFIFDSREPILIPQVNLNLDGVNSNVAISIVNLDANLAPISGEEFLVYEASAISNVSLDETRIKFILLNRQALKVTTTATGSPQVLQVIARLERATVR